MANTVLVTGANGHLGLQVCRELLRAGIRTRVMVRSDQAANSFNAEPDLGRCEVVRADLMDYSSLFKAVAGIHAVFHIAAPNLSWTANPQTNLAEPIIQGTKNLLNAMNEHRVQRFFFASSCSAAGIGATPTQPLHEEMWNLNAESTLIRSKIIAEKFALEFCEKAGIKMTSLLLPSLIGPGFYRHTPSTWNYAKLVQGMRVALPYFGFHVLDVRDAAYAFVTLYGKESTGRFIVAGEYVTSTQLLKICKKIDDSLAVSLVEVPKVAVAAVCFYEWLQHLLFAKPREFTWQLAKEFLGQEQHVSTRKLRSTIDWQALPVDSSVADTIAWIRKTEILALKYN